MRTAYRWLSALVGILFCGLGLALFGSFFAYQTPGGTPPLPGGPVVHYVAATAGCAFVAWGGGLAAAALRGDPGRSLGTATAVALVMLAAVRMLAWVTGDYYALAGELLRAEAAAALLLALAFVWLRPPAQGRSPA